VKAADSEAIYNPLQGRVKNGKNPVSAAFRRTFPCLQRREPVFSGRSNSRPQPEFNQPCVPFSTSSSSFSSFTSGS
jgi:hypothetical protein